MGEMQMRKVVSTFTYNKKRQTTIRFCCICRIAVCRSWGDAPLRLFLKGECVVQF